MMFVAATAMLFAACGKDEDDKTPVEAAANTVVYDGVAYEGESIVSTNGNLVTFSLMGENYLHVDGDVEIPNGSSKTLDLTRHDPSFTLMFHLGIGEGILDLQYQNYPQNYWCFLDGVNMPNESAFRSGTATCTIEDGQVTVTLSGVLINGKALSYKIVGTDSSADPR